MQLSEAIAMVKAAGYTVRKQVISRKKALSKVGPTFVAKWMDGEVTRMSIHCTDDNPDLVRAVRVSWAAYQSRTKGQSICHVIQDGRFERDGQCIHAYGQVFVPDYLNGQFY